MRQFHRWISTVCMLFLAWVSITGSLLALDELTPPPGLGGEMPTGLTPVAMTALIANRDRRLYLHNLLKELHTGTIVGISGRTLDVLTGLAFVILSVTGIVMYFQLLRVRRRRGHNAWFWG